LKVIDDGTVSNADKLGAIGDIELVIETEKIDDDLLVVAGDNLLEFEIADFVRFFREHGTCVGLKDVGDAELASQYGIVTCDKNGKVTDFEEKPPLPKSTLASICLYLFPKRNLKLVKDYLKAGNSPDAPGFYIQWLHKVVDVYGYVIQGPWYDIGDIDSYTKANELYEPG
jgi:glucose-1-phosphate thymidylyltransferase